MQAHPTIALGLALATIAAAIGTCAHPTRGEFTSSPAGVASGGPGQAAGEVHQTLLARLAGGASAADDLAFTERWPIKDQSRAPGALRPDGPPAHHRNVVYLLAALAIAAVVLALVLTKKRET